MYDLSSHDIMVVFFSKSKKGKGEEGKREEGKRGRKRRRARVINASQYVDFGFSERIALWEYFSEKFGDNFTSG